MTPKDRHAVALGRKGGQARTKAKAEAGRENLKLARATLAKTRNARRKETEA